VTYDSPPTAPSLLVVWLVVALAKESSSFLCSAVALVPLDFFGGGVAPVEAGVGWSEPSPMGAFSMVTRRWDLINPELKGGTSHCWTCVSSMIVESGARGSCEALVSLTEDAEKGAPPSILLSEEKVDPQALGRLLEVFGFGFFLNDRDGMGCTSCLGWDLAVLASMDQFHWFREERRRFIGFSTGRQLTH
jgi:hypothetical protein